MNYVLGDAPTTRSLIIQFGASTQPNGSMCKITEIKVMDNFSIQQTIFTYTKNQDPSLSQQSFTLQLYSTSQTFTKKTLVLRVTWQASMTSNTTTDIPLTNFESQVSSSAVPCTSFSTPTTVITPNSTLTFRVDNVQHTFPHFAWPSGAGCTLTLQVLIGNIAIDTNHPWFGFDATNYWIKQTANLSLTGTYSIVTNLLSGGQTFPMETFFIQFVNPCVTKVDFALQTIVVAAGTFLPTLWEVTAVIGTPKVFSYTDSNFKLEETPPSGITCPNFSYSTSVSSSYSSWFQTTSTQFTWLVPQTNNLQTINGTCNLNVALSSNSQVFSQPFVWPCNLTACVPRMTIPTTPQFYQLPVENQTYAFTVLIPKSNVQTCNNNFTTTIQLPSNIALTSVGQDQVNYILNCLADATMARSQNFNLSIKTDWNDPAHTQIISIFAITFLAPLAAPSLDNCLKGMIIQKQQDNLTVPIAQVSKHKIADFQISCPYQVYLQNNQIETREASCGEFNYKLTFEDPVILPLARIQGQTVVFDTTKVTTTFATFLKSQIYKACLDVSLQNYATVQMKTCFQLSFIDAFQGVAVKPIETIFSQIPVNQSINLFQGDLLLRPFQNFRGINLATIRPQSAGIFEPQPDSSIKVNWSALNESELELAYTFVFTFQDSNNPDSIFKAEVQLSFDQSLRHPTILPTVLNPQLLTKQDLNPLVLNSIIDLDSQLPIQGATVGEQMKVTPEFENLVKQSQQYDQDYYFYKPSATSGTSLELKARINYISASGTVEINFNQDIIFPENFLRIVNYFSNNAQVKRRLCSDCLKSQNMTAEELDLVDQFQDKPLISLRLYMGQYSLYDSRNLTYSWNATWVDKANNKFIISLTFDSPEAISASSYPDFLEVNFNYRDFFKNPQGAVLRTDHAFKVLPSIFDGNFDSVAKFVSTSSIITTAVTLSNATINLILSTSLSLLWTLINVMQLLVCLPLVDINYPANALIFNKIFISIANFDIIPVGGILQKIFKFGPQMPFSQSFDNNGSQSHSLMLNLGIPFVILMGSLLFLPLIYWLTKKLGTRYFNCYRVYRKLRQKLKFNFYLRMILEIFIDLAITSLVNVYNVKQAWHKDGQWGDKLSVVLAFIFITLIIIAPFWTAYIIRKHKDQLQSEDFTIKYGELTADLKTDAPYGSVWFLARRLIIAVILVNFRGYGFIQIMFLSYLQTAQIIYIGIARPYKKPNLNDQHLVSEYLIIVCIYHMFWFTDWVTTVNPKLSYNAGWSLCAIVSTIILTSILNMVWQIVQKIKKALRRRQVQKLKKLLVQRKTEAAENPKTDAAGNQTTIEAKFRNPQFGINKEPINRNEHIREILKRKQLEGKSSQVSQSVSCSEVNEEFEEEKIVEEEKVIVVEKPQQQVQIVVTKNDEIRKMNEEEFAKEWKVRMDKLQKLQDQAKVDKLLSISNDSVNMEQKENQVKQVNPYSNSAFDPPRK